MKKNARNALILTPAMILSLVPAALGMMKISEDAEPKFKFITGNSNYQFDIGKLFGRDNLAISRLDPCWNSPDYPMYKSERYASEARFFISIPDSEKMSWRELGKTNILVCPDTFKIINNIGIQRYNCYPMFITKRSGFVQDPMSGHYDNLQTEFVYRSSFGNDALLSYVVTFAPGAYGVGKIYTIDPKGNNSEINAPCVFEGTNVPMKFEVLNSVGRAISPVSLESLVKPTRVFVLRAEDSRKKDMKPKGKFSPDDAGLPTIVMQFSQDLKEKTDYAIAFRESVPDYIVSRNDAVIIGVQMPQNYSISKKSPNYLNVALENNLTTPLTHYRITVNAPAEVGIKQKEYVGNNLDTAQSIVRTFAMNPTKPGDYEIYVAIERFNVTKDKKEKQTGVWVSNKMKIHIGE